MPGIQTLSLNVPQNVIKALCNANIKTVEELLTSDVAAITRRANVSYEAILDVISEIHKLYTATPVRGDELYNSMASSSAIYSTGCKGIDTLLDGGLYTGEITELVGQPSTGKTQLCMSIAVSMITANTNTTIAYIDSSSTFSPERIVDMQSTSTTNEMVSFLNHIECYKCFDVFSLVDILYSLEAGLKAKHTNGCQETPFYKNLKLVVIDSLGALMAPVIGGKQFQGYALMANVSRLMKSIATDYNIAFVVTNHTVSAGEENRNKLRPALGESWSFVPNTQVMLTSDFVDNNKRTALLTKSSRLPCDITAEFQILQEGVQ